MLTCPGLPQLDAASQLRFHGPQSMKINTSHLVGAAIALATVFFSKLDAQDADKNTLGWIEWEYYTHSTDTPVLKDDVYSQIGRTGFEMVSMVYMPDRKGYLAVFKRPRLQPE